MSLTIISDDRGIELNAESVRAELWESPGSHGVFDTEDLDQLTSLDDAEINRALRAAADDAFWEQYDTVRRRAIAQLKSSQDL